MIADYLNQEMHENKPVHERLYEKDRERQEKLERKKREVSDNEVKDCTFAPRLEPKSA